MQNKKEDSKDTVWLVYPVFLSNQVLQKTKPTTIFGHEHFGAADPLADIARRPVVPIRLLLRFHVIGVDRDEDTDGTQQQRDHPTDPVQLHRPNAKSRRRRGRQRSIGGASPSVKTSIAVGHLSGDTSVDGREARLAPDRGCRS